MKKIISTALAGVFLGTTMFLPATPAFADRKRDSYMESYYSNRPHDDEYWRWRNDRQSWRDDDYRRWYRRHHRDDDDVAAGLFGFAAGAILGGAIAGAAANSGGGQVDRCAARYRSYDPASNTYLGYDGFRHQCTL